MGLMTMAMMTVAKRVRHALCVYPAAVAVVVVVNNGCTRLESLPRRCRVRRAALSRRTFGR